MYINQLEEARHGNITPAMKAVALDENVSPEKVCKELAIGHAVIPLNPSHDNVKPTIIGNAFRTKINANIGRSIECSSIDEELEKMEIAVSAGADFIMDLSVGPGLSSLRKTILDKCHVPVGTVPMYEALYKADTDVDKLNEDMLMSVVKTQAEEGVDFMTIHAGLLRKHINIATKRVMGIISRGGSILAKWMVLHKKENPFYSQWDEVMDICFKHDVTISLGDGLRPGCLADASDEAQFAEMEVLGKLVQRCRERGVQVMVEGPGHIPFDEIKMNMEKEQAVCDNAPFYVLGPVVTDIAPGYDHITSCIGATAAAYYGASLLCYVTPAEHLTLPDKDDVKTGVIAYKIAAHSADIAKKLPGAREVDDEMARARFNSNWNRQFELALDSDTAKSRYGFTGSLYEEELDYCSMCGKDFCAVRTSKELINLTKE